MERYEKKHGFRAVQNLFLNVLKLDVVICGVFLGYLGALDYAKPVFCKILDSTLRECPELKLEKPSLQMAFRERILPLPNRGRYVFCQSD